jgi:endoglucanase
MQTASVRFGFGGPVQQLDASTRSKWASASMQNRRQFLLSTTVIGASLTLTNAALPQEPGSHGVSIHEITMAAPDVICIELRDPPVVRGGIVDVSVADRGPYNTWLPRTDPRTGLSSYAAVIGPNKKHLRFEDKRATSYLNRDAIDDVAGWPTIDGIEVANVYRNSVPYDSGLCRGAAGIFTTKAASMKHYVFLKLGSRLAQGTYTVTFPPDAGIKETNFTFDDLTTRAISIRTSQVGHRPSDVNKLAYLSLWIPSAPSNGQVDFSSYGLVGPNKFQLITNDGRVVFMGNVVQRVAPRTREIGSGYDATGDLVQYADHTNTIAIKNISRANPGVVTTEVAHGLTNGERYFINGNRAAGSGMSQANSAALGGLTAVVLSPTSIQLRQYNGVDVDTSSFEPYVPNHAKIYKSVTVNRAGTYVCGLDYSSFTGTGTFRVRIPGLGVSDPFPINDAVWWNVAKTDAAGEYHMRSGCALDNRFGYSRPSAFRGGIDLRIYKSTLPELWSDLDAPNIGVTPAIPTGQGAVAPWITPSVVDAWGGWFDAGDWVQRLNGACGAAWMLLDMYEQLPIAAKNTGFGIPKSSEVLDQATYSAIDSMSDIIHQAIWPLDFYRRLQDASGGPDDGSVPSGMGMATGTGVNDCEPSWLYRGATYLYLPDLNIYYYAAAAAKLARILLDAGQTKLATLYQTSAVKAWNWAEKVYSNAGGHGGAYNTGGYADRFYAAAKRNSGWTDAMYVANMTTIKNCQLTVQGRLSAAASLFRLLGDPSFGNIVKNAWTSGPFTLFNDNAAWEYINASRADYPTVSSMKSKYLADVETYILGYSEGTIAYRNMKFKGANERFGNGSCNLSATIPYLYRAYKLSPNKRFKSRCLATLQAHFGFHHGANQIGRSFTAGLGVRPIENTTWEDRRNAGTALPPGITCYGYSQPFFLYILTFSQGGFTYIVDNPNPTNGSRGRSYEDDYENERVMTPSFFLSYPVYEAFWDHPAMFEKSELTIQQTMIPKLCAALFLSGHDGNAL